MSLIQHTVTEKKLAANRSNGAESRGPATEEGKERAKMNALQHGRYAARPDPAALFLADCTGQEEAEREALREETLRRYQTGDDFATSEATELADLRFELVRLERVKQVVWQRERELLELEQRRRRRNLQYSFVEATGEAARLSGLLRLPDSPAKWRECLSHFDLLLEDLAARRFNAVMNYLRVLYGDDHRLWRGERLLSLADDCHHQRQGEGLDEAYQSLKDLVEEEIAAAKESLELAACEQEPLSEAGQAARLLEATSSRKWNWMRQQENALRRSVDRKVRILLELRAQHETQARQTRQTEPQRPQLTVAPAFRPARPEESQIQDAGFQNDSAEAAFQKDSAEAGFQPNDTESGLQKNNAKSRNEPIMSNGIKVVVTAPEPGSTASGPLADENAAETVVATEVHP